MNTERFNPCSILLLFSFTPTDSIPLARYEAMAAAVVLPVAAMATRVDPRVCALAKWAPAARCYPSRAQPQALGTSTRRVSPQSLRRRLYKPTGALAAMPCFSLAVDDDGDLEALRTLSAACREGGAAAICIHWDAGRDEDLSLVRQAVAAVVVEQATADGAFPGPCPVLLTRGAAERLGDAEAEGVAAIVDRGGSAGSGALPAVLRLDEAEMENLQLGEDALAVVAVHGGQLDGGEVERARALHAAGVRAVLLDYSFTGETTGLPEAEYVTWVLGQLRTKKSGAFVSSAFGGLPVEDLSPGSKNPKLWRRAQKEAKEIMHDSKKKYGHLDKSLP